MRYGKRKDLRWDIVYRSLHSNVPADEGTNHSPVVENRTTMEIGSEVGQSRRSYTLIYAGGQSDVSQGIDGRLSDTRRMS